MPLNADIFKLGVSGLISLVAQMVKNLLQCRRPRFDPWVGKIPWRRKWQPAPVFLPGQRSLTRYSPWGGKELERTKRPRTYTHCWLIHTGILGLLRGHYGKEPDTASIPESGRSPGGRRGNPLWYPCLENPMDGGVLWAIVHWVGHN